MLEIGTGCGYHTAVLARLAGHVYSVEIVDALAHRAREGHSTRSASPTSPLRRATGRRDGRSTRRTTPSPSPRRRTEVPPPLVEQLAVGGRLIIPIGGDEFQTLHLIEQAANGHDRRSADRREVRAAGLSGHGYGLRASDYRSGRTDRLRVKLRRSAEASAKAEVRPHDSTPALEAPHCSTVALRHRRTVIVVHCCPWCPAGHWRSCSAPC